MNGRRLLTVVLVDVAVLADLAVAMYCASRRPSEFTLTFLAVFFGLLIPTLVLGRVALRRA